MFAQLVTIPTDLLTLLLIFLFLLLHACSQHLKPLMSVTSASQTSSTIQATEVHRNNTFNVTIGSVYKNNPLLLMHELSKYVSCWTFN